MSLKINLRISFASNETFYHRYKGPQKSFQVQLILNVVCRQTFSKSLFLDKLKKRETPSIPIDCIAEIALSRTISWLLGFTPGKTLVWIELVEIYSPQKLVEYFSVLFKLSTKKITVWVDDGFVMGSFSLVAFQQFIKLKSVPSSSERKEKHFLIWKIAQATSDFKCVNSLTIYNCFLIA